MTAAISLLIVEDDLRVAKDLVQNLKKLGYQITAVTLSGRAALAAIANSPPDLALVDNQLKDNEDGIETGRLIYEKYRVPVIFLAARVDEALLTRAETAGAYAYFLKPPRLEELNATIKLALRKHQETLGAKGENCPDGAAGLFDANYLRVVLTKEEARARRGSYSVGVIAVAADQISLMKDAYGAGVESYILGEIGSLLQQTVRNSDLVCHYDETTLLVLLPECSFEKTRAIAEEIRVASYKFPLFYRSQQLWGTISLGVACYRAPQYPLTKVAQESVKALAQAQREGGNRVVMAPEVFRL
ncbi:MAG: diguanylate cyclase domain-containing protein [Cyanobacteriota bacterium]|jgi:diguanylate cyclase (GGDEF)-like protein